MSWGRTLTLDSAPERTGPDTPVIREGEDEFALKMAYAAAVFKNGGDYNAAGYSVFVGPENYGRAMQAPGWRNDFDVTQELERLSALPLSVDDIKRELGVMLKNTTLAAKDRITAASLLLEADGAIKRGAHITNDNSKTVTNNVLRVPAKPITVEEEALYEARLEESQLRLVRDAKSSR